MMPTYDIPEPPSLYDMPAEIISSFKCSFLFIRCLQHLNTKSEFNWNDLVDFASATKCVA